MSQILVTGSIAHDYIMGHKDEFKNSIDKDSLDNLSVGFLIEKMQKESGGTGLNIAYNLAILEQKAILLSSVGGEFEFDYIIKKHIDMKYIKISYDTFSSSGYIISDKSGNQITAFYPGAMDLAYKLSINDIKENISYAIVAPNQKRAMIKYCNELSKKCVKTFFDPGQALFSFEKHELEECFIHSNFLIVNEYEFTELKNKSELEEKDLFGYFERIIITLGSKGSKIITTDGEVLIKPIDTINVIDPTGAGDAYRGGLLYGLHKGYDWETSAKIGSLMGSYCVQHKGGQNHMLDKTKISMDMQKYFGEEIEF